MNGKVSQTFLPPAAVDDLRRQATRLDAANHARDRREWRFGESVNRIWDELDADVKAEISREVFFVECSRYINAALIFPIVAESGETLRRWCEIAARFRDTPGIEAMREALSFDHFRQAVTLANKGKVSVPVYALAVAIEQRYTADEMRQHFDPAETPDWYARATGWLDSLETYAAQYANGNAQQIAAHVTAIRELLG